MLMERVGISVVAAEVKRDTGGPEIRRAGGDVGIELLSWGWNGDRLAAGSVGEVEVVLRHRGGNVIGAVRYLGQRVVAVLVGEGLLTGQQNQGTGRGLAADRDPAAERAILLHRNPLAGGVLTG